MRLKDDELVLVNVKQFKNPELTKGKVIAVGISFSWTDCLNGEIDADASIGLPITLRNKRVVSHLHYIKALVNLLKHHDFSKLKFILAAELQCSNLLSFREINLDHPNYESEKQRAVNELFELGKRWIDKFSPIIFEELPGKEIIFSHWRDLLQEDGRQKHIDLFQHLKKDSNIGDAYDNEVAAACMREHNKGREAIPELIRDYLDEEIPILMNEVSPENPNKSDYFLYPAQVPVVKKAFNALNFGHGLWTEIEVRIQTKEFIYQRSLRKNCLVLINEGISGTTLWRLTLDIEQMKQKELQENRRLHEQQIYLEKQIEPEIFPSQFCSSSFFLSSNHQDSVPPEAKSSQVPIEAEAEADVLIQEVKQVFSQFQQGNFSPDQVEILLHTLRHARVELLPLLNSNELPMRSGSPTISSFSG